VSLQNFQPKVAMLTAAVRKTPWAEQVRAGCWKLPSGYVKIAIENGHRKSGFTH